MAASRHIPECTEQPSVAHSHGQVWRGGGKHCIEASRARSAMVGPRRTHTEVAFRVRTDAHQ